LLSSGEEENVNDVIDNKKTNSSSLIGKNTRLGFFENAIPFGEYDYTQERSSNGVAQVTANVLQKDSRQQDQGPDSPKLTAVLTAVALHFVPFHFVPGHFVPVISSPHNFRPRSFCPRSFRPLVILSPRAESTEVHA
jgi:hypothetical protein